MEGMHMVEARGNGTKSGQALLARCADWWLPQGLDVWMIGGSKQIAGGLKRISKRPNMLLVTDLDVPRCGQIGATQGIIDHLLAKCGVGQC